MRIILSGIGCLFMGFFMVFLTKLNPLFERVYFDYIGMFVIFLPFIIVLIRMQTAKTYTLTEKTPRWKHYIAYMRRDNTIVPMMGSRTYPGESFIDVPKLGLVEFLGKDCWYNWGDKKILWGLENLCYTPDPRYSNLCHLLNTIGFNSSEDVKNVLSGSDLNLMGKTYLAMNDYDNEHGVKKLVTDMVNYDGDKVLFQDHIPQKSKLETIHDKVDDLFIDKLLRRKT